MEPLKCPKCQSAACSRTHREGFLQQWILPRLHRFPWTCDQCHHTFMAGARGRSRKPHARSKPGSTVA